MPIVYLHGAAIREQKLAPTIAALLSEHVAPALVTAGNGRLRDRVFSAYWGAHAVGFAWHHASLPVTVHAQEGIEDPLLALAKRHLQESSARAAGDDVGASTVVSEDQLSAVIAAALKDVTVAESPARASEFQARFGSRLLMRWRPGVNAVLTQFFGDIFVYLTRRGDAQAPGQIITDFLDVLRQAANAWPKEPLVVLSHSMGGQIMYDCATYFMPRIPKYAHLKVDYWVATGSQVPLFEEMKLFKASDESIRAPRKVHVPRTNLGSWCNIWDPNDLLSYTAEPIFQDVDDEKFESGLPIHTAHFGYLVSPVFYSHIADKLRNAIRSREIG